MPVYLYRREDGSTFTVKQHFTEDVLHFDPETGQQVVRVVQPVGVIFKGSGFYVNDSKNASKRSLSAPTNSSNHDENGHNGNGHKSETGNGHKSENGSTNGNKSEAKKTELAAAAAE